MDCRERIIPPWCHRQKGICTHSQALHHTPPVGPHRKGWQGVRGGGHYRRPGQALLHGEFWRRGAASTVGKALGGLHAWNESLSLCGKAVSPTVPGHKRSVLDTKPECYPDKEKKVIGFYQNWKVFSVKDTVKRMKRQQTSRKYLPVLYLLQDS